MKKVVCLVVTAFVLSVIGCASIVSDTNYPVSISSSPQGAKVSIEDGPGQKIYSGTTPTTVTLDASEGFFQPAEYTLICEKEGCNTRRATINSRLDGWYIGNILFGGLIGFLIVDPATGAMWRLDDNAHVNLPAKETASVEKELRILTINQVPKDSRSELVRIN